VGFPRALSEPSQPPSNTASTLEGGPTPTGWEALRQLDDDESEGRSYFVNHNKRETSGDNPRYGILEKGEEEPRENGELPKMWVANWSESGRKCFVDHNAKRTTWDDPRVKAISFGVLLLAVGEAYAVDWLREAATSLDLVPEGHSFQGAYDGLVGHRLY
jgi:hypothetical protein